MGRVRIEIHVAPGPFESCESQFAEIQDPVAGYTYLLDLKNQVAHRAPIMAEPARTAAEVASDGPHMPRLNPPTVAPLGSQTMMGLKVVGSRSTRNVPASPNGMAAMTDITETWMAPQLALIVYEKMSNPRQGTETTRTLKDLSTAEPDPNLFQAPASFKVVDETADRNGRFSFTVDGTSPTRPAPQPADGAVCEFSFRFPLCRCRWSP
jgi:hypothetical protein